MMTFDPGPGWREVDRPTAAVAREALLWRGPRGSVPRIRAWVPVEDASAAEAEDSS